MSTSVELAEDVERMAREGGLPVSVWLAEAAEEARRHQAALVAIADYEAEVGRFERRRVGRGAIAWRAPTP